MQITRNSLDTTPGPADWFTGTVYIDTMASPSEPSRVGAASVHFTPGARTAWHTHPLGQTIHVTEGVALCQRRGGPIEVIGPAVPAARGHFLCDTILDGMAAEGRNLLGLAEVAELLRTTRRNAIRLTGLPDFPEPIARLRATRVWKRPDVERWAKSRKPNGRRRR